MSFPGVVIKSSEFKWAEEEDNGVDFECKFGPWKCGYMMKIESSLWVGKSVIDFSCFLFADVKIVVLRRVKERVDWRGFNFDIIERPKNDLIAKC